MLGFLRRAFRRGSPLVILSGVESGVPLIRMVIMTRLLDLRELGISSALTATYATTEMLTDFGINRYVFSVPKERFDEALASAHALLVVRGALLAGIFLLSAPLIASALSLQADWASFTCLSIVSVVMSFQNLAPKVAERNYRYTTQLATTLIAAALSLTAMTIVGILTRSHWAVLAMMIGNSIGFVGASHLLADHPYRLRFNSYDLLSAFRFGYPLIISSFGSSIVSQGDRFVVGGIYGMAVLGAYSVFILSTTLPISLILRVLNTVNIAFFYNAAGLQSRIKMNLRLVRSMTPIIGCLYAGAVVTVMPILVPRVFGPNFVLEPAAAGLLGLLSFVRIVRCEPFGSFAIQTGQTKKLAMVNIVAGSALIYMVVASYFWHSILAVLVGVVLGEFTSLLFTFGLNRKNFSNERLIDPVQVLIGVTLFGAACVLVLLTKVGQDSLPTLTVLALYAGLVALWTFIVIRQIPTPEGVSIFRVLFESHAYIRGQE